MGRHIGFLSEPVVADDGTELAAVYHDAADGGDCIPKTDGSGGYYYVSNSEQGEYPETYDPAANFKDFAEALTGGVYSFEFNADHEFVGYKQVLSGTGGNCAGGTTPWNTWISCEERRTWGRCWQGTYRRVKNEWLQGFTSHNMLLFLVAVDPSGEIDPEPTNVAPFVSTLVDGLRKGWI